METSQSTDLNAAFAAGAKSKQGIIIRVGHPAYPINGLNHVTWHPSKSSAIKELRNRGFKRNDARRIVNGVCLTDYGYAAVRPTRHSEVVEVGNYTKDYNSL